MYRNNIYPYGQLNANRFTLARERRLLNQNAVINPFTNNLIIPGQNYYFAWRNPYTNTAQVNVCGVGMELGTESCYLAPDPGVPREYFNGTTGRYIAPPEENLNNPEIIYPTF